MSHDAYTTLSAAILVIFGGYYLFTYARGRTGAASPCCAPQERVQTSPPPSPELGDCNDDTADGFSVPLPSLSLSKPLAGPTGSGGAGGEDSPSVSRAAALSLVTLTTLSPCVGSMPVMMAVLTPPVSVVTVAAVWAVLLASAGCVMGLLAAVSFVGAGSARFANLRRHERLVLGIAFLALAAMTMYLLDHHDHDHAHHGGHSHHAHGNHDGFAEVMRGDMHTVVDGKREVFGEEHALNGEGHSDGHHDHEHHHH